VKVHLLLTLIAVISLFTVSSVGSSYAENSVNVEEEKMIALIGTGIDPDDDDLTYFWEQTSGELVDLSANDVAEPHFLAPSVNNGQTKILSFTLIVSDPFGGTTQESIQIIVNPINHDPTVTAGRDKIIFPSVNAITIFTNAHDADGDLLSYSWNQLEGRTLEIENMNLKHLTIEGSQLDFTDFTPLTFEVTVDDGFGGIDTDTVDVFLSIFSADSSSIAVDAGPIQFVNEGSRVTLHGEGWEIDNKPITYYWTQHLGPSVALSSTINPIPTFTAPNIDNDKPVVLSFVLTGYVPGSGYAQDTAIVKVLPVNHPPMADAGPDQTVREFSRVKLIGTGSDPDGDRITHSWSQTSGPEVKYNIFSTELSFVAPNVATDETMILEFKLNVRDSHGSVTTDTANITVNAINHPPTANAGPDQTVLENTSVQLFGFGFDSDNDPLTHSWSQISGPQVNISQSESSISFMAPDGISNKSLMLAFEFKVSDSYGGSAADSVNVIVVASNNGPTANAGPDREINENSALTLSCSGNDPDGDSLSYSWRQLSGPSIELTNPNNSILSFVTPTVVKTTILDFECTVTDGALSNSDTVNVTVYNTLTLDIIADAGDDRIVNENKFISLDGSASYDPENQPLKYSWTQLSGESVSLDNTNNITPNFTSPFVENGEIKILTFELTVSDNNGRVDSDTVTIMVDPINAPPEATVTARQIS
jgi:hypothetical protein